MINMGQKLKFLRKENGLTQKQIAERIGLAVSAVSSYESGARYPSYEVLVKLEYVGICGSDLHYYGSDRCKKSGCVRTR